MTKVTRENDRFVMQRAEDRSFFAAFDYYTTKYKLVLWLLGIGILAIGFDFKTPRAIFRDLQDQITVNKRQVDSQIVPKIEAVNSRVDGANAKIDILLRLRCVDNSVTSSQRVLSGLDSFCRNNPPSEAR